MLGSRMALTGPLAPHVGAFVADLERRGYTASPVKKHVSLVVRLSWWLDEQGLGLGAVGGPGVEPFFVTRRAEGVADLRTRAALKPLIAYLEGVGVLVSAEPAPASEAERLTAAFRTYLARERGLVEGTVRFYAYVAGLLIDEHTTAEGVALADLAAADVTGFTTRVCEGRGLSSCRQVVSALRAFLRFLVLEGITLLALEDAVLAVAGWDPQLPRAIGAGDVARLLAACDRDGAIGRRDYAILLLLSRLGLRGGEVVAMELGDIDWRAGEVTVRGKGPRRDRLPVPADVGEALVDYLSGARPLSDSRRLFLRSVAPFTGFAGTAALGGVLERACARAEISYASPHRLRHTTATELLRSGAALVEIGQVLRHHSSATTAVYAKVDLERLRHLVRPWPRVAS